MTHLGVYYAPAHTLPQDMDYIRKLQPSVLRIFEPDVQMIADMHALVPGAIICPRTWAIDDGSDPDHPSKQVNRINADPIGTAIDHANQYAGQLAQWKQQAHDRGLTLPADDHIYFNSANEPNQGGELDKIATYAVAFLNRCTELGLRATAPCLGVGWPNNTGEGTPVDWSAYTNAGLEQAINRGSHWLELHEYFDKSGPQLNWTWWAGRHLQCPLDVPILLGEIGMDNFVNGNWPKEPEATRGNRGWIGNVTPDQYGDMIEWHISHSDTRVVAGLVFITDIRNKQWESFNTRGAHDAFLARKDAMVPQTTPNTVTPPVTIHLPAVGTGDAPQPPTPTYSGIIDPQVAQAILQVESGGRAFGNDGQPLIRFEAHIFRSRLNNDELWAQYFQTDPAIPWTGQQWRRSPGDPWRQIHTGNQADEYAAFEFAKTLNADAAYNSISMGAGQVMGFNHTRVGFPTAQAMFDAFESAPMQTIAFLNYFLSDSKLAEAMQQHDWRTIAALYNGSGNVDAYSALLQQAYQQLGGAA